MFGIQNLHFPGFAPSSSSSSSPSTGEREGSGSGYVIDLSRLRLDAPGGEDVDFRLRGDEVEWVVVAEEEQMMRHEGRVECEGRRGRGEWSRMKLRSQEDDGEKVEEPESGDGSGSEDEAASVELSDTLSQLAQKE